MKCITCGSKNIRLFYSQKNVPLYQNFLFSSYKDAINCKTGDINLVYCYKCSFIYNSTFKANLIDYSINYENTQFYSGYFQKYIEGLINFLVNNFRNITGILEIGCGKGDFLKKLSLKYPNLKLYGFDKSLDNSVVIGNLNLYNYYYNKNLNLNLNFNLLILRHVLEHIYNPFKFLKNNTDLSKFIFIETPSFEWIIDNNAYWDIFYEHCNYFTKKSLLYIFKKNWI
ncbi:MAG: hypothetical protein KatS3mg068_1754 [Candidatus Sericytochromatia bacterium]|nr:MAG: hypothetical protein KatS3mg068_1754 [Candidatus Sericytochromatia bacterium]